MKQISLKPLETAVIVLFLAVFAAAVAAWNEHSDKSELIEEQARLKADANEYRELKKRWSLKESSAVYAYLKSHPNRTKHERRGGTVTMEFDNLSAVEFNRISNKILNSMLVVKKLSMKRDSGSKGVITVEFES